MMSQTDLTVLIRVVMMVGNRESGTGPSKGLELNITKNTEETET